MSLADWLKWSFYWIIGSWSVIEISAATAEAFVPVCQAEGSRDLGHRLNLTTVRVVYAAENQKSMLIRIKGAHQLICANAKGAMCHFVQIFHQYHAVCFQTLSTKHPLPPILHRHAFLECSCAIHNKSSRSRAEVRHNAWSAPALILNVSNKNDS